MLISWQGHLRPGLALPRFSLLCRHRDAGGVEILPIFDEVDSFFKVLDPKLSLDFRPGKKQILLVFGAEPEFISEAILAIKATLLIIINQFY